MASENEYNIEYDTKYDTDSHDDYSYSDSNSDSNTIESALEPSSIASRVGSRPKHSIGARIQAISFLELNMPHFEIRLSDGSVVPRRWTGRVGFSKIGKFCTDLPFTALTRHVIVTALE